jgi:hypothetical protein
MNKNSEILIFLITTSSCRGWGKNTTGLSVTFRTTEKIRKKKGYSGKKN